MFLSLCAAAFAEGHRDRPTGFPAGHEEALGPLYQQRPTPLKHAPAAGTDPIHRWNRIAIDASGVDHTPVAPGETRVFGEQLGPGRASRAMAIVHIAIFDAVNAIAGGYRSYTGLTHVPRSTSVNAAVAQAAHDTLVALYPSQADDFDDRLAEDLRQIRNGPQKAAGVHLGKRAAAAILTQRVADGSQIPEPRVGVDFITRDEPGYWRQDPVSLIPIALGAHWGQCKPFVLARGDQLRTPPPPALDSTEYATAFDEVVALGGDGVVTPTVRTAEQTQIGTYWAYDGTPSLCAPPRLYNQIAVHIADQRRTDPVRLARLLALVNVSMADAGMAIWDSKYFYQFWRPVTAVRESGDPTFMPLGAPASNLTGPNFTPPFPAYPSGHAGFGGALFQVLRRFYRTDRIPFTFVSDEFNGVTVDNQNNVRPLLPRSFASLSQAEEENGQSRIYLGIHWAFDKTEGIAQGRKVADYVFDHAFQPAYGR